MNKCCHFIIVHKKSTKLILSRDNRSLVENTHYQKVINPYQHLKTI